jgi:long-chain acyl-CoA synthetase
MLAILQAGGVVVPVNPRLSDAELAAAGTVCPPAVVLASRHTWRRCLDVLDARVAPRAVIAMAGADASLHPAETISDSAADRSIRTDRGAAGVVFFTSGSTGRPKGILLTHDNIVAGAHIAAEAFGLTARDRTAVCMQMCHSYTFTKQMLCHLGRGASVVVADDFFQAVRVLEMVDRLRCTTLAAVPSMHVMFLECIRRGGLRLPSLRLLISGGAPLPATTQLGLMDVLPHAEIICSYGLSEASPFVSWLPGQWARRKVGSVGIAGMGMQMRILDERGDPCPPQALGEVCVRGPNVMAGYLGNPEATARALRSGLLHTGDVGWLDEDGCLYLCGRRDDMILRGAENVYPAETEDVLCDHPAVAEAAVVPMPHPVLGQDLAAFVVLRSGAEATGQALRQHCQAALSPFKVPRWVRIVPQLPRTANGKILRRALRERLAAGELAVPMVGTLDHSEVES